MAQEPAVVAAEFVQVNLSETEVGLRSENGVLVEILPPGTRRLYWKGLVEVSVQVVDLQAGAELPADLVARLTQAQLRQRAVTGLTGVLQVQVPEGQCALLTVDGKVDRLLTAGTYAFWKYGRTIAVELVDLRLQAVEVSGQDIMTRDKVGLRLNLCATYRYADVLRAFAQLQKPADHLYRELQFGLRAAVGTRSLDELLEKGRSTNDRAERSRIYSELGRVIVTEVMPHAYLTNVPDTIVTRPNIKGVPVIPDGMVRFEHVWRQ